MVMERNDVIKYLRSLHKNVVAWQAGVSRKRVGDVTKAQYNELYAGYNEALKMALRAFGDNVEDLP